MSCLDSCFILGSAFDLYINIMRNWCPFAIEGCVLSYLSSPILIQTCLIGNLRARAARRAIIFKNSSFNKAGITDLSYDSSIGLQMRLISTKKLIQYINIGNL